jgi:hypothetical protein
VLDGYQLLERRQELVEVVADVELRHRRGAFDAFHELLGGTQRQLGELSQLGHGRGGRRNQSGQIDQRGRFLEFVDGIVGMLEELKEGSRAPEPLDVLPRLVEELIRLRFPENGAGRKPGDPGLALCATDPLEGLAQGHRNVEAEGSMSRRDIENAEPLVLEIAPQPGLDLIADDAAGPALSQAVGGEPHRLLQEFAGMVFADELVETLPVSELLPGSELDGFGESLLAADLDQPAVAVITVGCPFEHIDRTRPADETTQPLSHVVPVDQEHDARPQMGEETGELCLVRRVEAAGDEPILPGGQLVAAVLLGALPSQRERIEQANEEFQPGRRGYPYRSGWPAPRRRVPPAHGHRSCRYRSE